MSSLPDLLASQDALLREAALALPHEFSRCTYNMGHIRQAVYLCLTCATPHGICAACSIACHTTHEQLELFPKRHFRCDCPTSCLTHPCTLHPREEANDLNHYGQNFRGLFCRCRKTYDAKLEQETMIQCLVCEDWFHESCLNLRERPPPRESSPALPSDGQEHDYDDSEDEEDGLSPPLISADDYDAFVCAACVRSVPLLRRYAGTPGTLMIVRGAQGWTRLEGPTDSTTDTDAQGSSTTDATDASGPGKRPHSPDAQPPAKRPRHTCLAPPANPIAQAILDEASDGTGDVFLTEGFRERWCRCEHCLPCLDAHPYLCTEEETYEPPEDPDLGLSIDELGARALERLPRDQAIDGIVAFNDMRDRLKAYLRPFAQENKVVEAADVTRFFDALMEKRSVS